jgi:DNA invertase Pin-like site-specific DNA recombinase
MYGLYAWSPLRGNKVAGVPENQLQERRYDVQARGWEALEYVEHGVSGAKEKRSQFAALMSAVRRKHVAR